MNKIQIMQKNIYGWLLAALILTACGSSSKKDDAGNVTDKKAKLEKLKKEQADLSTQIASLQKDLALEDTASQKAVTAKLVSLTPIQNANFTHYVDLQGRIDATNISYVAPPNGQGGVVKALYVKQGDAVRKGQVLAKLDDQLIRQQIDPLRVQLTAAEDTYKRTKSLWDQG